MATFNNHNIRHSNMKLFIMYNTLSYLQISLHSLLWNSSYIQQLKNNSYRALTRNSPFCTVLVDSGHF